MKRTDWLLLLFALSFSICMSAGGAQSTDSSIVTYPLQVGNLWQYYTYDYFNGQYTWTYGWTDKVIGDTILSNNNKYAIITTDQILGSMTFWRQESSKVYLYKRGKDSLMFDFSKNKNDIYVVKPVSNNDTLFQIVKDQGYGTYLGLNRQYWTFEMYFANVTYYEEKDIVDGLGMTYVIREGGDEWLLTGAIIDGVKYGTITDVKSDDKPINPAGFELYPNYPNPFNGSTTISFSLPHDQNITVKIYDVLGREIAYVFNGKMSSGLHRVIWNGKNERGIDQSSGLYFCCVFSERQYKQMKMLMIK